MCRAEGSSHCARHPPLAPSSSSWQLTEPSRSAPLRACATIVWRRPGLVSLEWFSSPLLLCPIFFEKKRFTSGKKDMGGNYITIFIQLFIILGWSHVVRASLKLRTLLHPPPVCWDYRCAPSYPVFTILVKNIFKD